MTGQRTMGGRGVGVIWGIRHHLGSALVTCTFSYLSRMVFWLACLQRLSVITGSVIARLYSMDLHNERLKMSSVDVVPESLR